jgi:acyl-protein synthetase LuxE
MLRDTMPSGCRGKPATNKHRMNKELSSFAARLRDSIAFGFEKENFDALVLELFALQFKHNSAYRKICEARGRTPEDVENWRQIPAVPTAAFKELEFTSIAPKERTAVFHSSGTTEQKPSRHFHNAESLAVYESSLWKWFERNFFANSEFRIQNSELVFLTPPSDLVPHSSLVHMFETVRQKIGGARTVAVCQDPASRSEFYGKLDAGGSWTLDFNATLAALSDDSKSKTQNPQLILGTAFSFVHLLDFLVENNLRFQLPKNSRVMETGGYKNRSRALPKTELHALITEWLGVPRKNIICEYGMSELSSQAYDSEIQNPKSRIQNRIFHFPPWARVQIVSPETGREVADGETGLIRIFDLANVFSVAAIQTEDLGIRHGDGFELIGRAQLAESRGCSLMTV